VVQEEEEEEEGGGGGVELTRGPCSRRVQLDVTSST
jgi:hypothetical protein